MEQLTLLCDICQTGDAVRTTIHIDDLRIQVDLCETHAQPLRDLRNYGKVLLPSPAPGSQYDVVTWAQAWRQAGLEPPE